MKINFLTPALVAIVGLAFVSVPVTAQTTNTAPAAAPADTSTAPKVKEKKKSDKTPYSGSITAIDATSITVTGKKTLTLAIAATTTFKKDKAPATLADFAVGDKVTGSYTTDSTGALTAASVHKKTQAKAAAAAAPATPAAPAAQ